jgi:hypothetical protein
MPLIVQPQHYGWWVYGDGNFEGVLNHPDKIAKSGQRKLNKTRF